MVFLSPSPPLGVKRATQINGVHQQVPTKKSARHVVRLALKSTPLNLGNPSGARRIAGPQRPGGGAPSEDGTPRPTGRPMGEPAESGRGPPGARGPARSGLWRPSRRRFIQTSRHPSP